MEPIDVDELARRVREHRDQCQLSLRAAANEAGVPVNTLSRVERGFLPDLANYARITAWLGTDPGTFFPDPTQRREFDTTEQIRIQLHADPQLSDAAAEQIAELVANAYRTLATRATDTGVHLRADTTFKPDAAHMLGDILERLQDRILADPSIGSEPGWKS